MLKNKLVKKYRKMQKIFTLVLAASLMIAVGCGTNNSSKKATTKGVAQLCVKDGKLCDTDGNIVVLNGVSFGWHNWWSPFYNSDVVDTLAQSWGADVIRAAMGVEPDSAYLERPECQRI